jgi:hypothetical protein
MKLSRSFLLVLALLPLVIPSSVNAQDSLHPLLQLLSYLQITKL